MNIFVLCTGRSGSKTFAKACAHLTNFSAGHETRASLLGAARLAYPPDHIEVDNRLAWLLGRLDRTYGDHAYYVHLLRAPERVAGSYAQRWHWVSSIAVAYRNGILMGSRAQLIESSRDMVDTVTANIELFLRDKRQVMTIELEQAREQFPAFLEWIGAEGDLDAAIAQWDEVSNAQRPVGWRQRVAARMRLAAAAMRLPH